MSGPAPNPYRIEESLSAERRRALVTILGDRPAAVVHTVVTEALQSLLGLTRAQDPGTRALPELVMRF